MAFEMPMDEVHKVFANLQGEGILRMTGDAISLLDKEKLLRLTESVGRDPFDAPAG